MITRKIDTSDNDNDKTIDESKEILLIILMSSIVVLHLLTPSDETLECPLNQIRSYLLVPHPEDLLLQHGLGGGHRVLEYVVLHDAPQAEIKNTKIW